MQRTLSIVNLPAVRRNAQRIKNLAKNAKLFAVVKADAYGHGAEEVSRYIEDMVYGFCVAIVEEGISLRVAGITKPILVFAPPLESYDVLRAKEYSLTLTVNSVQTARLIDGAPFHIKVNTGMNRLGCNLSELKEVLNTLPPESIEGVYSHLYAPASTLQSERQRSIFEKAQSEVKKINPNILSHLSASGGILRGGKYLYDLVRCGILLYGYSPYGFSAEGFEKALKVFARRTQKTNFIGGGIGYNLADENYKSLNTYRLGYADGFFRGIPLGEKTLCMDAFIAKDGGDIVCVLDDAQSYAKKMNTIPYEVLTSVTRRSERIYER